MSYYTPQVHNEQHIKYKNEYMIWEDINNIGNVITQGGYNIM